MRRIREILRLKHECGATDRAIARSLGVARSTVALTLERVVAAQLGWPLPAMLTDRVLEAMLYSSAGRPQGSRGKIGPDWTHVHRELRRPGVTLMLLWEEYRQAAPDGYGYSRWCELYRAWEGRLSPTMRQAHPAGERMFVDYAGQTVELIDGRSGEIRARAGLRRGAWALQLHLCRGELDADAARLDRVACPRARLHGRRAGAAGARQPQGRRHRAPTGTSRGSIGPTSIWRPITARRSCRRGRGGPRDKAKVEVGVLVVERWILARLRNRRFFSLSELNRAIGELVADLNARPMRRLGVSRRDLFVELDRPALKSLPAEPYEYAEWRPRRVGLDYHVDIDGHYYSVPHRLIREQLDARITAHTVELFRKGERVAVHLRGAGRGRHTTIAEHMPSAHRRYAEWTIERIGAEAAAIGPSTAKLAAADPGEPAASRARLPCLPRHPAPGAALRRRSARSGLRPRPRHRRPFLRLDPIDPEARSRPAAAPRRHGRAS